MNDLLKASALEQARRIRAGELSSEELVRAYLGRIDRIDPRISAFVTRFPRALAAARAKDRQRREKGVDLPPFHGVPIGVKDLNLARGAFTKMGSRAFRYLWSPVDDVTVAAIRKGGFVLLGKLATSEFGALPVTEPDIHPPTRNPWNPGVTAGGSSGGSGAAVAAGLLPIAQGSDGAGSIRIPSAFCGLFGHKPSRERLANPYVRVDTLGISAVGPMARTVDDAAALLGVMAAGRAPGPPARRGPLTVRFSTRSPLSETEPEVAAAVARVADALAGMGHRVEEGAAYAGDLDEFLPIWQRQAARAPVLFERSLQPVTRWLRAEGKRHDDAGVAARNRKLVAKIGAWFGDADLWLTPTVPVRPPAIGEWRGLGAEETFRRAARLGPFTALFNLTGQPAASIPSGQFATGEPIGVQLIGRDGEDETVLEVARRLEEALPWHARWSALADSL
jgi:amidase